MLQIATALVAFGAILGSMSSQAQDIPTALQGVHRIVCLGDSITQAGEGKGGYVWLVRHYLRDLYPSQNIETLNAGISGHKSTDMLERFKRDVLDHKPDLLTISVGVNDVWHGFYDNHPKGDGPRGVPLDAYRKNVDEMVSLAQTAGIRVVILSTTVIEEDQASPENNKAAKYNEALRDIANKRHCLFIDFLRPFHTIISGYRKSTGGRDNVLTVDGVHMNASGNKVMAHTILSGLGVSAAAQQSVQTQVEKE